MRTSVQIREEIENMVVNSTNLSELLKEVRVLRSYGCLCYEDYEAIEQKIVTEKEKRLFFSR